LTSIEKCNREMGTRFQIALIGYIAFKEANLRQIHSHLFANGLRNRMVQLVLLFLFDLEYVDHTPTKPFEYALN